MNKKPFCIPLAIGSFPFKTPEEALSVIIKYFPELPLWPQLPEADEKEQMYVQYFEGIPGLEYDENKKKIFAGEQDDTFFEKSAEALTAAMEGDLEYFKISPDYARGFYYFLEKEEEISALFPMWIKGQITGPVSFSLVVTDKEMKPVLYDETFVELLVSGLTAKALWQIEKLQEIHDDVIIFIDEPYMASLGSSMVALDNEGALAMLTPVVEGIRGAGGLSGIHCCGNTDWSVIFNSGCDIISLDAYEYGDNFLLYFDEISAFLDRGGFIAWGIVPTSQIIDNENSANLTAKLESIFKRLEEKGISRDIILSQSFISPSCGLGNVEVDRAERIMRTCREISSGLVPSKV